jgi:hypothetical protein
VELIESFVGFEGLAGAVTVLDAGAGGVAGAFGVGGSEESNRFEVGT